MRIEAADHIAAAMQVKDHRLQGSTSIALTVQASSQASTIARGYLQLAGRDVAGRARVEYLRAAFELGTGLGHVHCVHGQAPARQSAKFDQFQKCRQIRMQCHVGSLGEQCDSSLPTGRSSTPKN